MAEKNCKKFLLCVLIVTFFLLTPQYCLYLHHKLMVTQNLCWERAVPFLNITCSPGVSLASPMCAIPLAWLVREPFTSGEHTAEKHEIAHSRHRPVVWQGGPSRAGSLVTSIPESVDSTGHKGHTHEIDFLIDLWRVLVSCPPWSHLFTDCLSGVEFKATF